MCIRDSIKADAQRQSGGEHRQQPRHQCVDALGRKARVFEDAQHREVSRNKQRQQRALMPQPPQRQTAQPVYTGQRNEESCPPQPRPREEQQADLAVLGVFKYEMCIRDRKG